MELRNPSARPGLIVDTRAKKVGDPPLVNTLVGTPGPFGRERVVSALPLPNSELMRPLLLADSNGSYVGDADGAIIGTPRVVVHRMLAARWTEDTRRLAG